MTAATVQTWADGYGLWHVRVPKGTPIEVIRDALKAELTAREPYPFPGLWERPCRVPSLDTAESIVWAEGWPWVDEADE